MEKKAIGYWDEKREKLKHRYKFLTDKDLSYKVGKENEMIELLSYKLGKTKQELIFLIVSL
jgi:hypothetical protein